MDPADAHDAGPLRGQSLKWIQLMLMMLGLFAGKASNGPS